MKRASVIGLIALLPMILLLSVAVSQEIETKVKGTGRKVKLERAGSGWEVGDTGRKVQLERSGSEIEVKGTDIKMDLEGTTKWQAEEAGIKLEEAKDKVEDLKGKLRR